MFRCTLHYMAWRLQYNLKESITGYNVNTLPSLSLKNPENEVCKTLKNREIEWSRLEHDGQINTMFLKALNVPRKQQIMTSNTILFG